MGERIGEKEMEELMCFTKRQRELKERGQCHVTHFLNFDARYHISGTAEATVAKLCTQVVYIIKCLAFVHRLLPNGRG